MSRAATVGAVGGRTSAISPNQPGTSVWISYVPSESRVYPVSWLDVSPVEVSGLIGVHAVPSVETPG